MPRWLSSVLALAATISLTPYAHTAVVVSPDNIALKGPHEGRQILVSEQAGEFTKDLTRTVKYAVENSAIARVTATGFVRPMAKGATRIKIEAGGEIRFVPVEVLDDSGAKALHFGNDIIPLLGRYGCNSGGCHGRASGQNGFKLSLFGVDTAFDYAAIVKEARGRRVFAASPDDSIFLAKGTGRMPHGGGKRLPADSEDYRTLRSWIALGAPLGDDKAPKLVKLSVSPDQRVMQRNSEQQLAVLAHYSDGSFRDVTRQAQYQPNEITVGGVDGDGLVRTFELSGETAIMARYMGKVTVFRALVPLGKTIAKQADFPIRNYIDELSQNRWKKLGIAPSELCTDGEFVRRVTLDVCGRLPTLDETKAFLADKTADRRAKLIDRLLEDRDYSAFFAMKWGSILRNASLAGAEQASYAFHEWIRDMVARNRSYDEFVRGIVAASGEWPEAPAVNWYWQMRDDQLHQPVADTAQVFLGLRLQCAKCHHHPYERWSQGDYYGLAGFFSRLARKSLGEPTPYYSDRRRHFNDINPETGKPIEPKALDGPELKIPPEVDPRQKLVDWMAEPNNPFFAKALVNRMWGHFMGRGLVDPVDDMRETNPPSNPELLDALAKDFTAKKFDVKHILRTICNSSVYQLSSTPNEWNQHDKQNHARFYGRRMVAEVLHDSIDQTCGTRTQFSKMSKTARAVDLPHEGFGSYFLDVFDRPPRSSACECARSTGASLSQVLHMANSNTVEWKVTNGQGRIAKLMEKKTAASEAVDEIYLAAFSRLPSEAERRLALDYVSKNADVRKGVEDVLWSVLNTREFMFNH